jgi:hypothetical protein
MQLQKKTQVLFVCLTHVVACFRRINSNFYYKPKLTMKKTLTCIALLTLFIGAQAQYKKASFLSKPGRYVELGGFMPVLKDGRSGGTGVYLSIGGVNPGGHLTFGYDLGVVLPVKFNYTEVRTYGTATSVTNVTGKSKTSFLFRYNLGYVFGNTAIEEGSRVLPFVLGNVGVLYGSEDASYTVSPTNNSLEFSPKTGIPALLYGASAGLFIKATSRFGLQISGGYNGLAGFEDSGTYKALPSHFFYSAGLRLLLGGEEE